MWDFVIAHRFFLPYIAFVIILAVMSMKEKTAKSRVAEEERKAIGVKPSSN
jgi:ABC-type uncharacterized transport system permease subunit